MSKRRPLDLPDSSRRTMMKWTLGVGAALGLRPWAIFEHNESLFGSAFAQESAAMPINRFVCNVMGDGSFAWMTQLYPFTAQATDGGEKAFYAPGSARDQLVEPGDHPMKLGPHAPVLGGKRVTGFLCGTNEAHTRRPSSTTRIETNVNLLAAAAAMQMSAPGLVPSIAVGEMPYGDAPGAPILASVPSARAMVELFGSTTTALGGSLADPKDALLFEAAYKANLGLHRAAGRPTARGGLETGKVASRLLARNFRDALEPTPDDLLRYGIDDSVPASLADIAKVLITTVKAFKLNLTNSVLVPGTNDDPHTAFDDLGTLTTRVIALGRIWESFVADLMSEPDPLNAGSRIGDNTVLAWIGDTGKHPNVRTAWPDSTPQMANWMYVLGGGHLKSGWFGQILGDDSIETWDPSTGANLAGGTSEAVTALSAPASGAVLHAIAKGQASCYQPFYRGPSFGGLLR